jgi:uncharacterized glyoxalase superfamily protein PhnB
MAGQTIFPALHYRDADAAIGFLKTAFGFDEKAVHRAPDNSVQHAELLLGDQLVMLGQYPAEGAMGGHPFDALASTISLYLLVENPDTHLKRAQESGATIVREIEDTDYGSREYSARDPEGNLWSFGTYDPNG